MNILETIRTIGGYLLVVLKIAKPIVEALRPALPEINDALDKIEVAIDEAGHDAAGYIKRNGPAIEALGEIGHILGDLGSAMTTGATVARTIAADGEITPAEAEQFLRALNLIKQRADGADDRLAKALAAIEAAS